MDIKEKILLYLTVYLTVLPIHAVIGRGEIWRKKQENGAYHYIYNMFDFHLDSALSQHLPDIKKLYALAQTQYQILVSNIKKLNKNERLILIEDPAVYQDGSLVQSNEIRVMLQKLKGDQGKDLLVHIINRMQQSGIEPIVNIDFRQKRVMGFGHVINVVVTAGLETMFANTSILDQVGVPEEAKAMWEKYQAAGMNTGTLQQYGATLNFKMKDVLDELYITINNIKNYQDGPILSEYYKEQIAYVESGNKKILERIEASKENTIREFGDSFDDMNLVQRFGASFLHIGSSLVDCKALHEIYQVRNTKKKVLLMAGATHGCSISNMLLKLGYELVYETGVKRVAVEKGRKAVQKQASADWVMNNTSQEEVVKFVQQEAKLLSGVLAQLGRRTPFNSAFFDLILDDNPELGWQPGHGPMQ